MSFPVANTDRDVKVPLLSGSLTKKEKKQLKPALDSLCKFSVNSITLHYEEKIRGEVKVLDRYGFLNGSSLSDLVDRFYDAINGMSEQKIHLIELTFGGVWPIEIPKVLIDSSKAIATEAQRIQSILKYDISRRSSFS